MKYYIILVCTILSFHQTKAQNLVIGRIGNVVYHSTSESELSRVNEIIAFICDSLSNIYYPNSSAPLIHISTNFAETEKYEAQWSSDLSVYYSNNTITREEGYNIVIKIKVSSPGNLSKKVIQLLEFMIHQHLSNDLKTISGALTITDIAKVLKGVISPNAEKLVKLRIYNNLQLSESKGDEIYFFANDTLNFVNEGKVYLRLEQIFQIIELSGWANLIFASDSIVYVYNVPKAKLSKRFLIENNGERLSYFMLLYNDQGNIYFGCEEFKDEKIFLRKFIYISEIELLIQDYQLIEAKAISDYIEKKN
jgi:hypothetical protein